MNSFDSILIIGFGGPTRIEEVRPFLANVTRGRNISDERIQEVMHHYELIGGSSPYNELTLRQVHAFEEFAKKRGLNIPVYLGMRNWAPYLKETLAQMKKDGVRRAIGFILAPHRSYSSFDQYLENVEQAKRDSGFAELEVTYVDSWFDHPLFVEAVADRVRERGEGTFLIFTAHSIPKTMAQKCNYVWEIQTSSRFVAERVGVKHWTVAYQSRSGRPEDPWLEPDVNEVIHRLAMDGVRDLILVPIGFISDHAEILYDLDHEAKKTVESLGIRFSRVTTVMDHPKFIEMMFDVIHNVIASIAKQSPTQKNGVASSPQNGGSSQ